MKGHYDYLMRNYYGYHEWHQTYTLESTAGQPIYKEYYIGYPLQRGYLLTKAQNKDQQAILSD